MGEIVKTTADIGLLKDNQIIGNVEIGNNVEINFSGKNNILYFFSDNSVISNCIINFRASNALLFCTSKNMKNMRVFLYHNCWVYYRSGYVNGSLQDGTLMYVDEGKGVFISSNHRFAKNIVLRTGDMHEIWDATSGERINHSKSIFIGDHVWLGYGTTLLKSTQIGSGAIVGLGSVVAGKKIPSNTSWAGNPAKQIKTAVMWGGGLQCDVFTGKNCRAVPH
ncbi:hypothetical protein FACS1894132_00640 [Clostridia bacterium]|nr:hypothetical protein FACS1894132_00640 [Clostridia bacterium]